MSVEKYEKDEQITKNVQPMNNGIEGEI